MLEGSQEIVVPIERTPRDYSEAYSWLRWHTWSWPLLSVLYAALIAWNLSSGWETYVFSTALLVMLFVALYYGSLVWTVRRMVSAHKKNGKSSYTFDREGFRYESGVSESRTAWEAVNKARETSRSILLIYANTCFLIIPKRNVQGSELGELRDLLRGALGPRARLRPA